MNFPVVRRELSRGMMNNDDPLARPNGEHRCHFCCFRRLAILIPEKGNSCYSITLFDPGDNQRLGRANYFIELNYVNNQLIKSDGILKNFFHRNDDLWNGDKAERRCAERNLTKIRTFVSL